MSGRGDVIVEKGDQGQAQSAHASAGVEIERGLARMRFLLPVLIVAMSFLYEPLTLTGALTLAWGVIAYNLITLVVISDEDLGETLLWRLGQTNMALDILVSALVFVVFVGDPASIPVAPFPFVAYEMGVRYGRWGIAFGMLVFTAALAGRMTSQVIAFDNSLRAGNIVFFIVVLMLLLSLSHDLRSASVERAAAVRERERIAAGFRQAVAHLMRRLGVDDREMTYQNITQTMSQLCATGGGNGDREAGTELGKRLAELISAQPENNYGLTTRELEILRMMAQGLTYKQIADRIYVSHSTARNHASHLMHKLGASSRHEAVELAREKKLVG